MVQTEAVNNFRLVLYIVAVKTASRELICLLRIAVYSQNLMSFTFLILSTASGGMDIPGLSPVALCYLPRKGFPAVQMYPLML